MPVLTGTPCLVIASRVQVYHSCSVDLTWQHAVHSCQRCPRAALVRSAVTMPAITQAHIERAHSRFCPAGVHMGTCVPASDIFAPSKSQVIVVEKPNSVATSVNATAELLPSVWGPANLPVPAASPHHPVHAAHLARASYPPAASNFAPISTTSSVQHFLPAQRVKLDISSDTSKVEEVPSKSIVNGSLYDDSKPNAGRPPSDSVSVPTVTIVREPQAVKENGVINGDSRVNSIVHSKEPASVRETNKVSVDTRTTEPGAFKKSKSDDGTPASSRFQNTSEPESISGRTLPINENDVRSAKTVSKSVDRNALKQPGAISGTDLSRPESVQLPNRVSNAHRNQISASGGVGDITISPSNKPRAETLVPSQRAIPPAPKQSVPAYLRKPVPSFHFPLGTTRMSSEEIATEMDRARRELNKVVEQGSPTDSKKSADPLIPYSNFGQVAKALNCSFYWKYLVYTASGGTSNHHPIALSSVLKMWQQVLNSCPDACARFVHMLTGGRSHYLVPSNFDPLIQDILESHPGLEFLREAEDFHSRYVTTVVSRIFFNINASWSGRISLAELRRSNFLSVLDSLEEERDINLVTQYFSYEHFYVIYCKFWELDDDHDLIISRADLARHNNYAISERMIDRIFSGTVTRGDAFKDGVMHYTDFVWFLLAEEDKRHPRSIEYWFRCMDLDGDGFLSMYELEYFYSEQLARMEEMCIEPISFEDCLCQCLDMVKPELGDKIRLADMKRCRLCHIFFDTFFNLPKYLQHEQRDPFSNLRDIEEGLNELSDWDRYAAEAYEMLITIENGNQEDAADEDDADDDDDLDDAVLVASRTDGNKQNANLDENKLDQNLAVVEPTGMGEGKEPYSPEQVSRNKFKRTGLVNGTGQK